MDCCAQLALWAEVFAGLVENTKGHVEKKQASTYEELVAEQEAKAEEVRLFLKLATETSPSADRPSCVSPGGYRLEAALVLARGLWA